MKNWAGGVLTIIVLVWLLGSLFIFRASQPDDSSTSAPDETVWYLRVETQACVAQFMLTPSLSGQRIERFIAFPGSHRQTMTSWSRLNR